MSAGHKDLTAFANHLARVYSNPPSYGKIWQAVVTGGLPGSRVGGRWQMPASAELAAVERFALRRRPTGRTGRTLTPGPEAA
jgi:hypothetical protein